jgi:arylsulfatase A-like enzyme
MVSNTPFRKYKHYVHEGGISTPLIVHWPAGIKNKGELRNQIGNVIDIMPTLVELASTEYPQTYNGHQITPVAGVSLVPTFNNHPIDRKIIFWEHEMNRAARMGKWKLVSTGKLMDGSYGHWKYYQAGKWELYNLEKDRTELTDLSGQYPEIVKEMATLWDKWANQSQVFPAPWKEEKLPIRPVYVDITY